MSPRLWLFSLPLYLHHTRAPGTIDPDALELPSCLLPSVEKEALTINYIPHTN